MKKIIYCLAVTIIIPLQAQPNHHIETTQTPTPGYDWKFEFVNMNQHPVDVELIDAFYFDENKPNYHPVVLPKTHILGVTKNGGLHYGYLRSTLDVASKTLVHLIVYYNKYRFEYQVPYLANLKFIWHGGNLMVEQSKNKFTELHPVKITSD